MMTTTVRIFAHSRFSLLIDIGIEYRDSPCYIVIIERDELTFDGEKIRIY